MSDSGKKVFGISRDMLMMVVALTLVTAISAALLGVTDQLTREPILQAQRAALMSSLEQVMPAHANEPIDDVLRPGDGATPVYLARDAAGLVKSFAWEVVAPDGYSGSIRILIGVLPDGVLHAVRVTDHRETPGLGDGIVQNQVWLDFFIGKSAENVRWAVKKDGGDFDQFTGATITPRAVLRAVHKGLEWFAGNRDALLARSLSGLKNQSENSAGRGQILTILQVNSRSIGQKSGEICTGQADLQLISFKSDRLPERTENRLWRA